jgi:tRNA(Ile)-lysidine synthase
MPGRRRSCDFPGFRKFPDGEKAGGPDSLALLHLLAALGKELSLSLHVAHLDHGLRKNSKEDMRFVAAAAARLGLGFTGETAKLTDASEETCRNARLAFLFRTAKKQRCRIIALGHTLDDQAETVLMRLIRGAGLLGLAGIAPLRDFGGYTVIRPLVEVTRKEIEAYLKKKGLTARTDETNSQDIYLRNRVRRELLPLLEKKYNRNIRQVLGNTAQLAGSDYDFLGGCARTAAGRISDRISLEKISRMHPSMRRMVLRLMAGNLQGSTRRLTARHIREIEDMVRNRPAGSVVDLPRDISVKKTAKSLFFYRS